MGFTFHRMNNGEYNPINVIQHVVIPKADHFIALRFQIFRSFPIMLFLLQMLASIEFNNKFGFG